MRDTMSNKKVISIEAFGDSIYAIYRIPGDVPRIGDKFVRRDNGVWQQQIHTGEFHNFNNPKLTFDLELAFSELRKSEKPAAEDFTVANHGSIFVLTGVSEACKEWIGLNVGNEETQTWGRDGIVVEHRYIGDIIDGLKAEGFNGSLN